MLVGKKAKEIMDKGGLVSDEIVSKYTTFKINRNEAITAVGTTAIIEAAYAEGVIGIAT